MLLKQVRIKDFRSINDTGFFDIEATKTVLVGPNEAGKTTILKAIESINPPGGISKFDWLRDFPRSRVNAIQKGEIKPSDVTVAEASFELTDSEKEMLVKYHPDFKKTKRYVVGRRLDNTRWCRIEGGPKKETWDLLSQACLQMLSSLKGKAPEAISTSFEQITKEFPSGEILNDDQAAQLRTWVENAAKHFDENSRDEKEKANRIVEKLDIYPARVAAGADLEKRLPLFVYFSNYFQVRPSIHLRHLADRIARNNLDDEYYDFGNKCLLQLLGFTAKELADLGEAQEPNQNQPDAIQKYKDQLDKRHYSLNAAQVTLTTSIRDVWVGEDEKEEELRLRLHADRQYLKVVVEDELGVEVELDQRSAGFQWLVSFFIVFRAQSEDQYRNAVLLLDEPGLSLHGLKQRQFRKTVGKLALNNQTIYTTHSPFMVGPEELQIVRLVEMTDRKTGTKVHTHVTADDPRSIFPLQEALGYDLAQSLFGQQRNLVCEGLTDYWYVEGTSSLLRDSGLASLNEKIAICPANNAAKVVYYSTILHSQKLKVAALLDSDQAGEVAATQDDFVRLLGKKRILRTKDFYNGAVTKPEIEDVLRETLVKVAKTELDWDVAIKATSQPSRPIVDIFTEDVKGFSKYKLAKTYLKWTASHKATDLSDDERTWMIALMDAVNKALSS